MNFIFEPFEPWISNIVLHGKHLSLFLVTLLVEYVISDLFCITEAPNCVTKMGESLINLIK